jgi:ligand-binding sensor domain-containing protein/DNA-binding CsgD family transcriptional regulator
MKGRTVIIILIVLCNCLMQSYTAPYPDPENLQFLKLDQSNGLPHNNIECIYKDCDGLVWFGTRNGLCSYNGYDIKVYWSGNDPASISGDRILSIAEDKSGNLWIGTYSEGLNKFNKRTEKFTRYNHIDAVNERINRISVFSDSTIWICTNKGLAMYIPESDSFMVYRSRPNDGFALNSDYVYDIIETNRGEVYVATESDDIQRFDRDKERFFNISYRRVKELSSNYRKRIVEDVNGVLWISANVHGLCSYDPASGESEIYLQGEGQLTTNVLNGDMAVDREGNIWICTDGGGINILDPQTRHFRYIRKDETREKSLSTDHIYCIYFDELNTVWIGTFGEGVNYYNPDRYKFRTYFITPGDLDVLKGKSVLSVYQDSKNRLWAGTDGYGLYRFDSDGSRYRYNHDPGNPNSLTTDVITSLNEDGEGNMLIGTYSGGLLLFNPEKNTFIRFDNPSQGGSPTSINIWQIVPDSKGRIWLGLLGEAVDLYDRQEKTFKNFGPNSALPDKIDFENVMSIMEDRDGDIWFGTEGEGIYILENETGRLMRIAADSADVIATKGIIRSMYQDRWGYIWIGSEGQGLFRFDKNNYRFVKYSAKEELPNNIVQSIIEDSQGKLWIGTSGGLCILNPETGKIRTFVREDGLSSNEFNQNSLIRLSDGRLAIGSTKGLDIFSPLDIKLNQNLPAIVFSKLEILNKEVKAGTEINKRVILQENINYTKALVLTHREKVFALEFAAINYILPEKCQYKYMLRGFDDDWIETGPDYRRASYSNLEPGEYIFRVIASNNDGKWGNNERSLIIRVRPSFYNTWLFRIIMIIILLAVVYFIYRYRLNLHKSRFMKTQAEQEKRIIQLEKDKLEMELQKLTFHMINRNRVLVEQKNRLMGLSVKAKESVRESLEDVISIIDEYLNDDKDWAYIEPQLDKVYNNFVSRLKEKHRDLNLSEIKIAAYVRMNLGTKEISEFMHKTPRAIENDRYRLRKKIGLDSNDSLKQYLMNL